MKTGKRMGNDPFKTYKDLITDMDKDKYLDCEKVEIQESALAAVIDSRETNNKNPESDFQQILTLLNELNQNLKELKQEQENIHLIRQDLAELKNARNKYLTALSRPWQIWFPWLP
jgi:uncharacterized protein YpuA (DUF1002 family)